MPLRRRLIAFVTIVAAVVLVSPPLAGADGTHNHVTVVNRIDDRTVASGRAVFTEDQGPTVYDENTAYAYASCSDCRTVAVAVQVVALERTVSDFRPVNAAVALNEQCIRCQTYAYARQEVIAVDGDFRLSDAGEDALRRLKDEIDRVAHSDEPFLQMGAELDGLTAELVDVVRRDIGRSGLRETGRTARRDVERNAAEKSLSGQWLLRRRGPEGRC